MPDYQATCGPLRATVKAPDKPAARVVAVHAFREQDPQWWKLGMVELAKIVRVCSCGRTYTLEEWRKLPLRGVQRFDEPPNLEMRNCPCGSTRGLEIDRDGLPWRCGVRNQLKVYPEED